MDIKKVGVDKHSGRMTFVLKASTPGFVNTLRRVMMEGVPTLAIDTVRFAKNSGALYDEMVAHRLGLIPLVTDLKTYVPSNKCKCEGAGCAQCTLKLTIKTGAAGPVLASQLKSADPKAVPVYDMPIVKLLKGQELEFEATARMGAGSEHAKWSPCLAWYRYFPIIEVDEKNVANPEEIADNCPTDVFKVEKGKLKVVDANACTLCGQCADLSENGAVKLNESDKDFLVFVEPWGQLSVKDIVVTALEIISAEAAAFEKAFNAVA